LNRKTHPEPSNFLIGSGKRLLQHNLPRSDICSAAKQRLYSITSSAPTEQWASGIVKTERFGGFLD